MGPTIVVEQIKLKIFLNGAPCSCQRSFPVPPFVKIKDQVRGIFSIAFKKGNNDVELYLTRKPLLRDETFSPYCLHS